jgi:ribonuclease HI
MKAKYNNGNTVTINTDASYSHLNKTGGYGIWIKSNYFIIKNSGKFKGEITDANEAEIKAVINAFEILSRNECKFDTVYVNCDNQVVRSIIRNKKVAKRFKVEGAMLLKYIQSYKKVIAKDIKGHSSGKTPRDFVNNWCDNASRNYYKK